MSERREAGVMAGEMAGDIAGKRAVDVGATAGSVVETHGLRKTFESEGAPVRALRGVDFTMSPGEFVAVMGPSGCGKSTLLNIVAGLDTPTDGDVCLAGEDLVGKTEDELAIMR